MSENPKVRVLIEWGDLKHTAEGDLDTVVREVMQFAAKVLPNYSLASKLTFSPDYSAMVEDLAEAVKLTPEGEVVLLKAGLSAENTISIVLLAVRVANAVGMRPSSEMSPETISKAIGKAVKTVRNSLAIMAKTGIVERTSEGNYKLTVQGVRKAHEFAKGLTSAVPSASAPTEVAAAG